MREKLMVSFSVDNLDETFADLKAKGVTFITEPTDMPDWGMRTLYLRDPEENLIELFTPLADRSNVARSSSKKIRNFNKKVCYKEMCPYEWAGKMIVNEPYSDIAMGLIH